MNPLAAIRTWLGTVLLGGLLGYVLTAFAVPLLADTALFGGTGESREARAYMLGILQEDPELLASVTSQRGLIQRALQLQGGQTPSGFKPVSLTFLGGRSAGPYTIQAYAVELRPARGPDRFFPLVLTLIDGKVVRSD